MGNTRSHINSDWRLIKKIGSGIHGSVYQAVQTSADNTVQQCAIKRWVYSVKDEGLMPQHMWNEMYCMAKTSTTQDRKLPHALCFRADENTVCMMMPMITPGWDACDLIRLLHIDIQEVMCLFTSLLESVSRLHSTGVVHNDIRSQNVLVSLQNERYSLCLIDMGVSSYTDTLTLSRPRGRSHRYQSPPEMGKVACNPGCSWHPWIHPGIEIEKKGLERE